MTDRNALATSMSRRAGRGGPLDEGRRRGTQDGQAVPLGGHRETLWSWAQAYVEAAAIALTLTLTLTLTRYGDGGRGGSRPGFGVLGGNPRPGGPSPVNPRPGGLSPSSKTMPMTMTMPAPMTTMTMTMPMRSSSSRRSSSSSRPRRSSSSSCSSSSSRGAAARQQQQRAAAGAAAATTALRALSCCRVCHRVCGGDRWSPMPRGLCHRSNLQKQTQTHKASESGFEKAPRFGSFRSGWLPLSELLN